MKGGKKNNNNRSSAWVGIKWDNREKLRDLELTDKNHSKHIVEASESMSLPARRRAESSNPG